VVHPIVVVSRSVYKEECYHDKGERERDVSIFWGVFEAKLPGY